MLRALLPLGLLIACGDKDDKEDIETEAALPDPTCVAPLTPIEPELPWKNVEELCADPNRGQPWGEAIPPIDPLEADSHAVGLREFLKSEAYKKDPYSWIHDANWRLTGPFEGCSCPPGSASDCKAGSSKGPHPAVRMYYSPEVIDWMCTWRRTEQQLPDPDQLPDGSMIIKEMISPTKVKLALVPGSDKLWVAPPDGEASEYYDQNYSSWTIMIKSARGSADGWYWADLAKGAKTNPPIFDRAAFTTTPYPGSDGKPVESPPGPDWYPTYWQYSVPDAQYPNNQFGSYCLYCHASADTEPTFASLTNILGTEHRYTWTPALPSFTLDEHLHGLVKARTDASTEAAAAPPFPRPTAEPSPTFTATFPELSPAYPDVWASRLPSHTWDHQVSMLGVEGHDPASSQFLTSDQCEGCHEAGGSGQRAQPYMVELEGKTQIDLSPWAEWSVSPMGLAGRDPIFHSQLELERNLARSQPGLADIRDCIDNTCLHCHGAAGARQYNIDTKGQGPAGDPCAAFLPPKDQRAATDNDGKLFTQSKVMAWRDEDTANASYGGLARDGINCAICHHISDESLSQEELKNTFTGNFRTGPPDRVYGPFPNEASKEEPLIKPMEQALGITPEVGDQTRSSELCGTCHTVYLPVFDQQGTLVGAAYEQTTYLEWLLSDFSYGENAKSCQDCHMPDHYQGKAIKTGIANIQNSLYPEADYLLPDEEVENPERPYNRHQLVGLNIFLNAFAQQYPLLMGVRQQDYMNGYVRAPLLTGQEAFLEVARAQTVDVSLGALSWEGDTLSVPVTVQNEGGHSLPSGVGFRRAFVELQVLDDKGHALWASGRTNASGVLLSGLGEDPLPTERHEPGVDGLPFQPHHTEITSEGQVQIYEEINQTSTYGFSSSFLHRYWTVKDNRLRPKGWNPARVTDPERQKEYGEATTPGHGPEQHWWPQPGEPLPYKNPESPATDAYKDTYGDPDYQLSGAQGLSGADSLVYKITLTPEQRSAARSVVVSVYSQAIPPTFLRERFDQAAQPGAESEAATRLYYMASHLNTEAKDVAGASYMTGYRLQLGERRSSAVP